VIGTIIKETVWYLKIYQHQLIWWL